MVPVRQDKRPQELRRSSKAAKDGKVVQRLLGIALILDGRGRSEAASLVGLDPQTLARAVQHYNADGIAGLKDRTSPGRPAKLTDEQSAELKRMVLAGPEDRDHGCPEYKVRHIVDLVKDTWGIRISPETARTRLHAMNLVPLVCRPRPMRQTLSLKRRSRRRSRRFWPRSRASIPRRRRSKSGCRMKAGSARKAKSAGAGPRKAATRRRVCMAGSNQPGCSAPSVPNATSAPLSSLSR